MRERGESGLGVPDWDTLEQMTPQELKEMIPAMWVQTQEYTESDNSYVAMIAPEAATHRGPDPCTAALGPAQRAARTARGPETALSQSLRR